MKKSKFTEAQIAFILRQAEEGTAVGEVCRKAGISEAIHCNWRKKYAGLMPSEMKRLRQLEEENGKLKTLANAVARRAGFREQRNRFSARHFKQRVTLVDGTRPEWAGIWKERSP
jgi:putative transposase